MFYVYSYTPTETLTEENAHIKDMVLANGIIHQVDVLFQNGCNHETFVQIFQGSYQLWPSNRGEKLRGNATVVSFREFFELGTGKNDLRAKIWTSLESAWAEVIIQVGILPKKILQPLSFDELVQTALQA